MDEIKKLRLELRIYFSVIVLLFITLLGGVYYSYEQAIQKLNDLPSSAVKNIDIRGILRK